MENIYVLKIEADPTNPTAHRDEMVFEKKEVAEALTEHFKNNTPFTTTLTEITSLPEFVEKFPETAYKYLKAQKAQLV